MRLQKNNIMVLKKTNQQGNKVVVSCDKNYVERTSFYSFCGGGIFMHYGQIEIIRIQYVGITDRWILRNIVYF